MNDILFKLKSFTFNYLDLVRVVESLIVLVLRAQNSVSPQLKLLSSTNLKTILTPDYTNIVGSKQCFLWQDISVTELAQHKPLHYDSPELGTVYGYYYLVR